MPLFGSASGRRSTPAAATTTTAAPVPAPSPYLLYRPNDGREDPVEVVSAASAQVGEKLQRAHRLMDDTRELAQDNLSRALAISAQERQLEVQVEILEQEARQFERQGRSTRKRFAHLSRRSICGLASAIILVVLLVLIILIIKL